MADRQRIIGWHQFTAISGGAPGLVPTYAHPRPQKIRDGKLEHRRAVARKGRMPVQARRV